MSSQFQTFLSRFSTLNHGELSCISSYWRLENLKKGGHFLRAGATCDKIAFIEEGVLRTFVVNEKNKEVTCSFIVKNTMITDIEAYLNRSASASNFISVTDCRLLVMYREDEQKLIQHFPEWPAVREKIIVFMMAYFMDIHAMQIHQDARTRYNNFAAKFPEVLNTAPLNHIASFLGIAQPSLSRIRKTG